MRYELLYIDDPRSIVVNRLLTSGSNVRRNLLGQYGATPLPQLRSDEIDELESMSTKLEKLNCRPTFPLEDVYGAALYLRVVGFKDQGDGKHYGYRGQRDSRWHLVPTILRHLPDHPGSIKKTLEDRLRTLAVFCEAMKQLLGKGATTKLEKIAIAQHYGIPSPLVDLTWSPWIALYFASRKGEANDVGVVQCFSIGELSRITAGGANRLGRLRLVEMDFVPRIKAQKGFFLELPHEEITQQFIPVEVTFLQRPNLVFVDEGLGVIEAKLLPSETDDPVFAFFDRNVPESYPSLSPPTPLLAEDYVDILRSQKDYSQMFKVSDPIFDDKVNLLCRFHHHLQSYPKLRRDERSFTRLLSALATLWTSQMEPGAKGFCDVETLVREYANHAYFNEESKKTIFQAWNYVNGKN